MPVPQPLHDAAPPDPRAAARVVRTVAIALPATLAVLAAVLVLVDRPDWWRGLLAATVVSALAAAASLPPIVWGLRRGTMQAVAGFFMALGARAVVSVGGCVLAILAGDYPAAPTLLLMVAFYFVLLAAETAVLAKALWSASASADDDVPSSNDTQRP